MPSADLLTEAARCLREGEGAALVTVVGTRGSTPQRAGARILVFRDGRVQGTIGGGCVEAEMIRRAKGAIETGEPVLTSYDLTPEQAGDEGLVCGGRMEIFIEPLEAQPRLFILGAGHVAKPICRLAAFAGFRVSVADDRDKYASVERFPEAEGVEVVEFERAGQALQIDERAFVVVVTRGHHGDAEALASCLPRTPRFLGLMGSKAKMAHVFSDLMSRGFGPDDLARITTPVGVEIGALTPEEIAISIVAEMIAVRRGVSSDRVRPMRVAAPGRFRLEAASSVS